jgi:carbon storage regulator
MLVLSRQRDETIMIGDDIEVTVVDIRGDKVRLGINAPKEVSVHRKEVYDAIRRENRAAAQVKPEDVPGIGKVPRPGAAGNSGNASGGSSADAPPGSNAAGPNASAGNGPRIAPPRPGQGFPRPAGRGGDGAAQGRRETRPDARPAPPNVPRIEPLGDQRPD